jgi:hypothetical protein
MLRRDASAKISAAAAVVFLLSCLAPWSWLGAAYSAAWCAVFNAFCGGMTFGSDVSVHFTPGSVAQLPGKEYPLWHAILAVTSASTQATARFGLNLRAIGYVPTVTFVALLIAWPLDRRRSWGATAIGFALVQAYFVVGVVLPMLLSLSNERVQAVDLGPAGLAFVSTIFNAFVVPPAMSYAVPTIVYAAVAFVGSGGSAYLSKANESRSTFSGFRMMRAASNGVRKAFSAK